MANDFMNVGTPRFYVDLSQFFQALNISSFRLSKNNRFDNWVSFKSQYQSVFHDHMGWGAFTTSMRKLDEYASFSPQYDPKSLQGLIGLSAYSHTTFSMGYMGYYFLIYSPSYVYNFYDEAQGAVYQNPFDNWWEAFGWNIGSVKASILIDIPINDERFFSKDENGVSNKYIAILNHNLASSKFGVINSYVKKNNIISEGYNNNPTDPQVIEHQLHDHNNMSSIVNYEVNEHVTNNGGNPIPVDGWSLYTTSEELGETVNGNSFDTFRLTITNIRDTESENTYSDEHGINEQISDDLKIGAVSFGSYFDMPRNPDLKVKIEFDFGDRDTVSSSTGSYSSNTLWDEPPKWNELPAWELRDPHPYNFSTLEHLNNYYSGVETFFAHRGGRRRWHLSFSQVGAPDLFGSNQSISNIATHVGTSIEYEDSDVYYNGDSTGLGSDTFKYNLFSDNNFFSQVWNKTLGGTLPFIFQPNNKNNNPDQFAICKIKKNSLDVTQSSPNVFNFKLIIEEVW